jgi:hypothetical protein
MNNCADLCFAAGIPKVWNGYTEKELRIAYEIVL